MDQCCKAAPPQGAGCTDSTLATTHARRGCNPLKPTRSEKSMETSSLYLTTVAGLQEGAAVVGGHLKSEGLEPSLTRFMFLRDGLWGHWFDVDDVVYSVASFPRSARGGKAKVTALTRGGPPVMMHCVALTEIHRPGSSALSGTSVARGLRGERI